MGTTHLDDNIRKEIRRGFWEAIAVESPPPAVPGSTSGA